MTRRIGGTELRNAAVVVGAAALLIGAVFSGVAVADTDGSSVSVTGETGADTVEAAPGETVTVTVDTTASDVSAYQANLTFSPEVVRVVSVNGTDDFDDPVVNVDNENGWVSFNQYRASNVDDPRLATLTIEFVGDRGDGTTVSFVGAKLSDESARERGIQWYDGLRVAVESDESGASSDGEAELTQTEIPGFGVTTVLAAGALLYGFLRFGRRKR